MAVVLNNSKQQTNEKVITEYKEYINHRLASGFDFNTWHQHQYCADVGDIDVTPTLQFDVFIKKYE